MASPVLPDERRFAKPAEVEKIWTEVAENEPETFTADAKQRGAYRANVCAVIYPPGSQNLRPLAPLAYILRVMAAAVSYNRTEVSAKHIRK